MILAFVAPINIRSSAILACVLVGVMLAGCKPKTVVNPGPPGVKNMISLVMAYNQSTVWQGKPPKSVADIAPFLQKMGKPEELLVSPRDHKPYGIVWGLDVRKHKPQRAPNNPGNADGTPPTMIGMPIVAYEQEGVEGKRKIIDLAMTVRDCAPEEFSALKLPPK